METAQLIVGGDADGERSFALSDDCILIGRTDDCAIVLPDPSVSAHHARIEIKSDGYYLVDLGSTNGVTVNGEPATLRRLRHEDRILFGDVSAIFREPSTAAPSFVPDAEASRPDYLPAARNAPHVAVIRPAQTLCPACGAAVSAAATVCHRCGNSVSLLPAYPPDYVPPVQTGGRGPGVLPWIALLASLSVIGFPVGIVLGLIALALVRRYGGTRRDRTLAGWAVSIGFAWMMALAAVTGVVTWSKARAREAAAQQLAIEANESQVIRAIKNLACAQKYARAVELADADADGNGEYASLAELARAGTPYFDPDLADGQAFAYRFEMLQATENRFLAVASPLRYGKTGIRTFAIDQTGQLRGGDIRNEAFNRIAAPLPVMQGERNAYYEIDDEIAGDILNVVRSMPLDATSLHRSQRILARLKDEFALTSVGQELLGVRDTVDGFVMEIQAQALFDEAQGALATNDFDVALARLAGIRDQYPGYSRIAAVDRQYEELTSRIAESKETLAQALLDKAEALEREGRREEAQALYQKIEKQYPDTDIAYRVGFLKPDLQRLVRERNAEALFSEIMDLSPARDFERVLNLSEQFERNYADTEVFDTHETVVAEQARKSRAGKWRANTLLDMEAGHDRAALAKLEAAAAENPDLVYDLRDLFVSLYGTVAAKLMADSDPRHALELYEKRAQLSQGTAATEDVQPEILAKLHNDVGQADFEKRQFESARWHLSSASWNYRTDPQFNLRLGVSCLFTGNYTPALDALTRAISLDDRLNRARLYRAYLHLRHERVLEDAVSALLMLDTPAAPAAPAATSPAPVVVVLSPSREGQQDGFDWNPAPVAALPGGVPQPEGVPPPADLDLNLTYNFARSRQLLPEVIGLIQEMYEVKRTFREEKEDARGRGSEEVDTVEMRQFTSIADFRNRLSDLRAAYLQDKKDRGEMAAVLDEMARRLGVAQQDMQKAGEAQMRYRPVATLVLPQLQRKRRRLETVTDLFKEDTRTETAALERGFELAESLMEQLQKHTVSPLDVPRLLKDLLWRSGDLSDMDRALISLQSALAEKVNAEDILRSAEGAVTIPDAGTPLLP